VKASRIRWGWAPSCHGRVWDWRAPGARRNPAGVSPATALPNAPGKQGPPELTPMAWTATGPSGEGKGSFLPTEELAAVEPHAALHTDLTR